MLTHVKLSGFTPKTMSMHIDFDRLFVSMKEGALFVLDVSTMYPMVLFTINFPCFARRINIDAAINQI